METGTGESQQEVMITGAPKLVNEVGRKRSTPTYRPNRQAEFDQIWCEDTLGEYFKGHRGDF